MKNRLVEAFYRRLYRYFGALKVDITLDRPVVTFVFDDFPANAWTVGGRILEAKGWRGTYFTSMGILGTTTELGPIATEAQLREVADHGHEIANHSLDHRRLTEMTNREIRLSIQENQTRLGAEGSRNFTPPQGRVSPRVRWQIARLQKSARAGGYGVNRGQMDIFRLNCTPIYSHHDFDHTKAFAEDVAENGGWLIYYTHDIQQTPTEFGCTEERFQSIVDFVETLPVDVMRLDDVVEKILASGDRTT